MRKIKKAKWTKRNPYNLRTYKNGITVTLHRNSFYELLNDPDCFPNAEIKRLLRQSVNEDFHKLKIGRTCFSCEYRGKKQRDAFYYCKNRNRSVWRFARCQNWDLTRNIRRIKEYERYVETRHLLLYDEILEWFYTNEAWDKGTDKPSSFLGICCLLCQNRSKVNGKKVYCKNRHKYVQDWCCCKWFKLFSDHKTLDTYKRYMKKSGADVSGIDWIKKPRCLAPIENSDKYGAITYFNPQLGHIVTDEICYFTKDIIENLRDSGCIFDWEDGYQNAIKEFVGRIDREDISIYKNEDEVLEALLKHQLKDIDNDADSDAYDADFEFDIE